MSGWLRRPDGVQDARSHDRARGLAAERMDGTLAPTDEAWLTRHLEDCEGCRTVANDYESQHVALRALRGASPEPPRDLWPRTAAAIDAGGAPRGRPYGLGSLPLAPAAGLLVVALVVVGVLNGSSPLLPGSAKVAEATPIAIPGGVLQVISRDKDGSVEILSRQLDQVCPMGTTSCGLSDSMDVTQSAQLEGNARLAAIISPTQDNLVVFERGPGPQRLYVLPVPHGGVARSSPEATPASVSPHGSGSPAAERTPVASGTVKPTSPASDGPAPTTEPSVPPTDTPTPSTTEPPPTQPTPTNQPSDTPTGPPGSLPAPTPAGSEAPTPAPSVAVSPGPGGALEIASDVTVVGSAAGYSADGGAFAFSARPADGSAGPDVFVWQEGDARAIAVTTDHMSVFNGWLGNRLLISRIVDGNPATVILDLETGGEEEVGDASMWRPAISPDGQVAAWWDGTLKPVDDGQTWAPDKGKLVLAPWPKAGAENQVLADGPINDWEVLWDRDGSVVAVWVSDQGPDEVGRLSLYPVDRETGLADLKHPVLEDAPAFDSISLRPGHLAWSAPDVGGDTRVDVLAWEGSTLGRLQLSTIGGASVVR